jgi:hypothetical protein
VYADDRPDEAMVARINEIAILLVEALADVQRLVGTFHSPGRRSSRAAAGILTRHGQEGGTVTPDDRGLCA